MSKFIRQPDGYRFTQTEKEISGTEVYILNNDGSGAIDESALPVVGTTAMKNPSGTSIATCICRTKVGGYVQNDVNTIKYTFEFSTQQPDAPAAGSDINTDPNNLRFDMGTEAITIGQGFTMSDGAGAIAVKNPVHRIIPCGSFTVPKGPLNSGNNTAWWEKVIARIGKINAAQFAPTIGMAFRKGSVLFEGVTGGTIYVDGELRWAWEMRFSYKFIQGLIRGGAVAVTEDDWLFVPAEDGKFTRLTPALYQSIDFTTLL